MRQIGLFFIFCLSLSQPPGTVHAQAQPLQLAQTVSGQLAQDEQFWTVAAQAGQLLAARAEATSGNLTPQLEWLDPSGKSLIHSIGSSLNNHKSAAIEAFTVPASGTYSLRVSAAAESSGDYTLTLLPGFSTLLLNDPMDGDYRWQPWQSDHYTAQLDSGKLRLQYTADNRFTWTLCAQIGSLRDAYVQTDVHIERQSVYSEYGLLLRGTTGADGLSFYVFMVNSDGKYRFALSTPAKLNILQDWTPLDSSLYRSGAPDVSIGVLAQGNRFTLMAAGRAISTVTDGALDGGGAVGLVIGTGHAPDDTASILFDNVLITVPPNTTSIKLPSTLRDWQRAPELIAAELQAAHLLSSAGKPAGTISQALIRNYSDGLVIQKLSKEQPYKDLMLIANLSWDTTQDGVACGLATRYTDDKNFTITYIDRRGGYGVRQVKEGRAVISEYAPVSTIKTANLAVNQLIFVTAGDSIVLYVNGTLAAYLHGTAVEGIAVLASYNYQAASARCEFNNVILYAFDS